MGRGSERPAAHTQQKLTHVPSEGPSIGGKSFKSFEEWNFIGLKFLTIALSLKDIELGLKGPIQSVAGLEYACLS